MSDVYTDHKYDMTVVAHSGRLDPYNFLSRYKSTSGDYISLLSGDVDALLDEAVQEQDVKLVGLSALMTTTVVSMEETIKLLRKEAPDCKVMVGGAVLNQDYADMIGADFYGKDAMQSVYYAQKLLQKK